MSIICIYVCIYKPYVYMCVSLSLMHIYMRKRERDSLNKVMSCLLERQEQ